jgi:hypothetical protein
LYTWDTRWGGARAIKWAAPNKLVAVVLVFNKTARRRANDTTTTAEKLGSDLVKVLLAPFKE